VSSFRFLRSAAGDLQNIAAYTPGTWGQAQADRYLSELAACCQRLADNPRMGRLCSNIRPGLRRLEHGKHVLFYRQEPGGILVSRILHQRMLPEIQTIDD
jgi:toxin ParE1/3/4